MAQATFTQPIEGADGAVGAPTYSFTSDTNTGMTLNSADSLGLIAGGALRITISSAGMTVDSGGIRNLAGNEGAPSFTFVSDTDSGMYSVGADNIGIVVGASKEIDVSTTTTVFKNTIGIKSGTGFAHTISGTPTADRAVTLPDKAGTIAFTDDTGVVIGNAISGGTNSTVIYKDASGDAASSSVLQFDGTDLSIVGAGSQLIVDDGTDGAPGIISNADTDSGITFGLGNVNLVTNSIKTVESTSSRFYAQFVGESGDTDEFNFYRATTQGDMSFRLSSQPTGGTGNTTTFFLECASSDAQIRLHGNAHATLAGQLLIENLDNGRDIQLKTLGTSQIELNANGTAHVAAGYNGSALTFGAFGVTAAVQAAHIADPTGGGTVDAEARTAIDAILVVLETFGFTATS